MKDKILNFLLVVMFLAGATMYGVLDAKAQVFGQNLWRMLFSNGASNVSTVVSDYKVGVGTTTPNAKLAVDATSEQTNPVFEVASTTGSGAGDIWLTVDSAGLTTLSSLTVSGTCTGCAGADSSFTFTFDALGNAATTTDIVSFNSLITSASSSATTIQLTNLFASSTIIADGLVVGSNFNALTGGDFQIDSTSVLNATTLGTAVLSSSLTSVGTLAGITATGVLDFSGATSISLVTDGTVNAEGECTIDGTTGQLRCYGGGAERVFVARQYPSLTYATTTAWSGTTTLPIGTAFIAESWSEIQCFTDVGTLMVNIQDATPNRTETLQASTTAGTFRLATNNTFTAGEKRYIEMGTPASAPTELSCTVSKAYTAD